MLSETFAIPHDGRDIFVRRWAPEGEARASFQISHGLGEHGARYARLAQALTGAGYVVYASDHRGHGPTCPPADLGFFAETKGWRSCLDDLHVVANEIDRRHAGLPQVFFGHSMGSYLGQTMLAERGGRFSAGVLSGSNGAPPAMLLAVGKRLAGFERWRLGPRGKSPLVQQLIFGAQNKPFKPARTDFDWLSRDAGEVDKYVADPLCGFAISAGLAVDLLEGLQTLASPELAARIPKGLPIYVFKGERDPVAANLQNLIDVYRATGLKRVTYKVYPDARHETLNETNRDEVTTDLLGWLKANVA
jgi:alpha-beta hydrolase superfamily lysophospholipase